MSITGKPTTLAIRGGTPIVPEGFKFRRWPVVTAEDVKAAIAAKGAEAD